MMNLFSVCWILPKKCHVAPSPLDTLTTPRATRGIAHYTRTGDIPPSPGIIQPAPSAGWERRGIQLPRTDMSESFGNTYPKNIRSRRFNFPGQLDSSETRDSPDLFPPTIKKQTLTILTIKSPEPSLIFNARYARQNIPKSSHIA